MTKKEMRKIKCETCGDEFYYNVCDRSPSRDEGYCSDICWQKSPEYNERRTLVLNFYNMLSYEQKRPYWEIINKIFSDCNYCHEFMKWMDKEEDRSFKKVKK
jgi:hypothetical protein